VAHKLTRRQLLKQASVLVLGAGTVGLAGSCGGPTQAPGGAAPVSARRTRVTVAQTADVNTMDPHNHSITITANVLAHIYDSLGIRNPAENYRYEGRLAESWEVVDDRTVDLKLRQGVTFSNGEPFDAECCAYNLNRLMGRLPGAEPPFIAPSYAKLAGAEVLDEHTVRVTTSEVDALLIPRLLDLEMVPKRYTEEHGFEKLAQEPIGTGPYVLKEWVREEHIVLEAREDYWRGRAAIDEVVFRPIPEDATRMAELQAGNLDLILNVPPDNVPALEGTDQLVVKSVPSTRMATVLIETAFEGPLDMSNTKVRQALNYAIDRDAIIEYILGGYGTKLATIVPDFFVGYDPNEQPYPYDPQKARELLAEAGYPDGFEIKDFRVGRGRFPRNVEVAQAIVDQLAQVNINVTLNAMEFGVWAKDTNEHIIGDMSLAALGNTYFDAWNSLFTLCRSGNVWAWYSNPEVDALIDEAGSTLDPDKHEAATKQALQLIREDPPFIFLYQLVDVYAMNRRLQWEPRSDELVYLYDASVQ
jgi:peptide/nickel transport system substrate-binding protein